MKKLLFAFFAGFAMFPMNALAIEPNIEPGQLPEPATLILIITGLAGVVGLRRIFKK
jgi:hypothetical protein